MIENLQLNHETVKICVLFSYQERGAVNGFNHESLKLQFKLDNEFDLVFVVS